MVQDEGQIAPTSFHSVVQLSTVIAGVVYATGFLVVFNYLDMLGIRDARPISLS